MQQLNNRSYKINSFEAITVRAGFKKRNRGTLVIGAEKSQNLYSRYCLE